MGGRGEEEIEVMGNRNDNYFAVFRWKVFWTSQLDRKVRIIVDVVVVVVVAVVIISAVVISVLVFVVVVVVVVVVVIVVVVLIVIIIFESHHIFLSLTTFFWVSPHFPEVKNYY